MTRNAQWAEWLLQVRQRLANTDAPMWWRQHEPVKGPAPWPGDWSPETLRQHFGHVEVEVQSGRNANPNYEIESPRHTTVMPFGEFMDTLAKGPTNDLYMTARNSAANGRPLAEAFEAFRPLPWFLRDQGGAGEFLWIGRGSRTPLHHDLTQNLLVQLYGTRIVHLVQPEAQPRLANTRWVFSDLTWLDPDEAGVTTQVLRPGDMLFVPVGWWHQVECPDWGIMASFTNFLWPNDWTEGFPP